jgi:CRISPR type III-A-associated protein Csm2
MKNGSGKAGKKMSDLTEAYLTTEAEDFARKYANRNENIYGQLRKFYDEFKILERRINEKQGASEEWFKKEILPLIKFVQAKIAYSAGRKLIEPEFKKEMDEKIKPIGSKKDFKHFMLHYQAIIAYYKYFSTEKENQEKEKKKPYYPNKQQDGGRR